MVTANARALLAAGSAGLQPGTCVVDLGRVAEADSSALAVMLGWLRTATTVRAELRFAAVPSGVASLAELYGVAELLPLA
ncbi:MAG: STAS domain-containing protein [Betaproteobacteria bacterium]|nr:STAS domain-containing protein [Betaproteobacteria bacterium]